MPEIRQLKTSDENFWRQLDDVLAWEQATDGGVVEVVNDILADVKKRGDAALLEYTQKFDRVDATAAEQLELSKDDLQQALERINPEQREALELAAARVRAYAERQKMESWSYTEADGTVLGQKITPMDRAGLYVPGGKAAYPSSVLMNAIPAKVAEVPELIMVVPTPGGETNDLVLAAAAISGVDRVFTVGGAQAVAALAYGTETIPKVDIITGPGNSYVATAKRM
ncbi:MAG: histidinol dehydrogenase, partial [Gammaproteobacteria bacterium]|nr:histidinol dehydrogenase [Gammaproteobacteria bacterium]